MIAEVDAGADLDRAAHAALENRVGPLFWRSCVDAGVDVRIGAERERLEREVVACRTQSRALLPLAMTRIVGPLRTVGLDPLVFKGPAVARLYPDPALRAMSDIDLLLPGHSHRAGVRALVDHGWEDVGHQRTRIRRAGDNYHTVLVHPELPQMPVELHWNMAAWHERATGLSVRDLWKSRQQVSMFGVEAFSLPAEEDLVALANHAGKPFHHFEQLIWIVDLVAVIASERDLDWEKVGWLADRWRCRTVLAVALHQARRLGASVPDPLLTMPAAVPRRAPIGALLQDDWPFTTPDDLKCYALRHTFADSSWRRAELLVGEIVFGESTAQIPRNALRLGRGIAQRRLARISGGIGSLRRRHRVHPGENEENRVITANYAPRLVGGDPHSATPVASDVSALSESVVKSGGQQTVGLFDPTRR